MTLKSFDYFSTKAQDWKATSYGDIGISAGYGGGLKHLKLWSPSKNLKVNSIVVHGKVGLEVEIKSDLLNLINGVIQNLIKGKEAATAESSYKPVKCYAAFSITDYIGALCAGFEESITILGGLKVGGLIVSSAGGSPLFSIPAEVENAWGIGGGATTFSGFVVGVGVQFWDYNMQQRFLMEKKGIFRPDPGKI
jgi:hypothetical protein